MNVIKVLSLLFAIVVLELNLTACETVHGAGRDIEHAGESVQEAAD